MYYTLFWSQVRLPIPGAQAPMDSQRPAWQLKIPLSPVQ